MPSLDRISVWYPAFGFSMVGATVAWVHRFADAAYGENEPWITFWGCVILGSICKMGFLCCVPFLLRRIFLAMDRDGGRALRCAASWAVASGVLIALSGFFYDDLTELLNTGALHYYPLSLSSDEEPGQYIGREAWLPRWQSGQVLAIEAGYALALILLLVGIGYGWKSRGADHVGQLKVITACLMLLVVCIAWPYMFGLVIWDYDTFIGAMVSGSLSIDLLIPFLAYDPTSQIGFSVFAAFTLSTYVALRPGLPEPEVG